MDFIKVSFELFQDSIAADELCLSAEAQKPTKELVAHRELCCHYEVALIVLHILNNLAVSAKAVDDRIKKTIDEAYLNKLLFSAEHGEDALRVCVHVYLLELGISLAGLACSFYITHTVNAVGGNPLAIISKQIVEAVIDEQLKGADSVTFTVAALDLLIYVINSVFEILETDFLRRVSCALKFCAHRLVYLGNVIEGAFIAGLDSANVVGVGGDFLCLMFAYKVAEHGGKTVSLSLIDKP